MKKLLHIIILFFRGLTALILLLLIVGTIPYLQTEIFKFKEGLPFSGDSIYNPYQNFNQNSLRSNFHAHSKGKFLLTNGNQTPTEIYAYYKSNGYDVASLSNYMQITINPNDPGYIPVYEHGYSIWKRHQLVVNAGDVTFLDFPFFQGINQKQTILKRLQHGDAMVALAHPEWMGAITPFDMKYLGGYNFIEVLNHFKRSVTVWDAALTSGHVAWLFADDDCHDITKPGETFVNWLRIGAKSNKKEEILHAISNGCHYGVRNSNHTDLNFLDSCTVTDKNIITIYTKIIADSILFFSADKIQKAKFYGVQKASYRMLETDPFVRTEIYTQKEVIYLNPLIRYNGKTLNPNLEVPEVNHPQTFWYRTAILLLLVLLCISFSYVSGICRLFCRK